MFTADELNGLDQFLSMIAASGDAVPILHGWRLRVKQERDELLAEEEKLEKIKSMLGEERGESED